MSDERALLAAILSHPEEDTPRLMFADWLEENGQPERAEFIRLQIERSRLAREDPRWRESIGREAELLVAAKRTWMRPYTALADFARMFLRRGIVEVATTNSPALVPHLDSLRELTALLELQVDNYSWTSLPTEEEPPGAPSAPQPAARRGWFGSAWRVLAGSAPPVGAPAPTSYLCRVSLAARAPGLRVRAILGTNHREGPATLALDLLDPEREELDWVVREGTWTVLAWAPDVPDEWRLVGRLTRALCAHTREAPIEFFRRQFAARPVRSTVELAAWCGMPHLRGKGPHWLRFCDGVAVERFTGFNPPTEWLGGASL